MKILNTLESYRSPLGPQVVTIGIFDGVHPGHRAVLSRVVTKAKEVAGESVVLSFVNHPSQVLQPKKPTPTLCTPLHKTALLHALNIDALLHLTFTTAFSRQEPEIFLLELRRHIPFSHLILGYDSKLGKNRTGDTQTLSRLAASLGFQLEYVAPEAVEGVPISSSQIRNLVSTGDLSGASSLLQREYSIYSPVHSWEERADTTKLSLDVSGLCLPPEGVYSAEILCGDKCYHGLVKTPSHSAEILCGDKCYHGLVKTPSHSAEKNPLLTAVLPKTPRRPWDQPVEVRFGKLTPSVPGKF